MTARRHLRLALARSLQDDPVSPPPIPLAGGSALHVTERGFDAFDPGGRLIVRFEDGRAEIHAPDGDIVFAAPRGNIVFRAGKDVTLESEGALTQRAAHALTLTAGPESATPQLQLSPSKTALHAEQLDVRATTARAVIEQASLVAHHLAATATTLATRAERIEVEAHQIVERARDRFADTTDLLQTTAGRARTFVKDLYSVVTGRTTMESTEETSIDGKRVLLG